MKKILITLSLLSLFGMGCNRTETNEVQRENAEEISTETGTGASDQGRFPAEGKTIHDNENDQYLDEESNTTREGTGSGTLEEGSSDEAGMGMDE